MYYYPFKKSNNYNYDFRNKNIKNVCIRKIIDLHFQVNLWVNLRS